MNNNFLTFIQAITAHKEGTRFNVTLKDGTVYKKVQLSEISKEGTFKMSMFTLSGFPAGHSLMNFKFVTKIQPILN